MLYKITPTEDPFDLNPELNSIAAFVALKGNSGKKFKYVAFLVDYKSPYRQQPLVERKRLSALAAGYSVQGTHQKTLEARAREIMNGEDADVEAAITEYKSQQYDEDRENVQLYQVQIDNIKKAVRGNPADPAELEKINKLLLSLPSLKASQREYAIGAGIEVSVDESSEPSKPMSTIDEVMNEQIKLKDK
jgi:hypothetical protein